MSDHMASVDDGFDGALLNDDVESALQGGQSIALRTYLPTTREVQVIGGRLEYPSKDGVTLATIHPGPGWVWTHERPERILSLAPDVWMGRGATDFVKSLSLGVPLRPVLKVGVGSHVWLKGARTSAVDSTTSENKNQGTAIVHTSVVTGLEVGHHVDPETFLPATVTGRGDDR